MFFLLYIYQVSTDKYFRLFSRICQNLEFPLKIRIISTLAYLRYLMKIFLKEQCVYQIIQNTYISSLTRINRRHSKSNFQPWKIHKRETNELSKINNQVKGWKHSPLIQDVLTQTYGVFTKPSKRNTCYKKPQCNRLALVILQDKGTENMNKQHESLEVPSIHVINYPFRDFFKRESPTTCKLYVYADLCTN